MKSPCAWLGVVLLTTVVAHARLTPVQVAQLPAASGAKVDFARDVRPIFDTACVKCHGKGKSKGGFSLETRASFFKGGDSGSPLIVGQSAESLLIELVAGFDPDTVMPKKGSKLKPAQVAVLRAWVDQGAPWPEDITVQKAPVHNLHPRQPVVPVAPGLANPVDRLLQPYFAARQIKPAPPVEDRVFARRVYFDVIGLPPSPEELQGFLADAGPNKRERLVNQLLDDQPRYAEHWLTFWNDLLRNDYKGTGYIDGGRRQISSWLYRALYTNQPFNQFVTELIHPGPNSMGFVNGLTWRGAVNASQTPPLQAAQNIAQVFLGVNLKCASCHDSFINDYTLADAYGLAAIYATNDLEIAECDKPTGRMAKVKFLYPELGAIDLRASPDARQAQLAALLTARNNGRVTRTIVNRLWARFLGRGLVEPVDEMDAPAWSADVLDWLAEDFADGNYNLRRTMRWMLTSRAYQMPSVDPAEGAAKDYVFTGPLARRLGAEQFRDALARLTDVWFTLPEEGVKLTAPATTGRTNELLPKNARWIWIEANTNGLAAKEPPPAKIPFLRKTFTLASVPAKAYATVVSDHRFVVLVNGTQVATLKEPTKPGFIHLQPHLRVGENVIAVTLGTQAREGKLPKAIEGKDQLDTARPAGFFFAALFPGETLELHSDQTWQSSAKKTAGWEQPGFDASAWTNVVTLGAMETQRHGLTERLEESLGLALVHDQVRSSLVAADPLALALGRPNREQIASTRPTAATTLQALELTNGKTLDELLQRGARKLLANHPGESAALVANVFLKSLGRSPTEKENALATALIGSPARAEGVEDLLWSLAMLPEFQLIY